MGKHWLAQILQSPRYEVKNLNPGTPYRFQVRARNSAGVSDPLTIDAGGQHGYATSPTSAPTTAPTIGVTAADPLESGGPARPNLNQINWSQLEFYGLTATAILLTTTAITVYHPVEVKPH